MTDRSFDIIVSTLLNSHRIHCALPPDIVAYNPDEDLSRLVVGSVRGSWPVALCIDGACRGIGTASARAAFGVFLGESSSYNSWGILPTSASHTSQAAEIYAALQAVKVINTLTDKSDEYIFLIITDSDYLFKSITMYIYNWVKNGFLNANGLPVVNGDAFRRLHASIVDLELRGIRIRFWRVDRAYNQDADHLANQALDFPPNPLVQIAYSGVAYLPTMAS